MTSIDVTFFPSIVEGISTSVYDPTYFKIVTSSSISWYSNKLAALIQLAFNVKSTCSTFLYPFSILVVPIYHPPNLKPSFIGVGRLSIIQSSYVIDSTKLPPLESKDTL